MIRIPFQTQMRQGTVDLLQAFKQDADLSAQIYGGRPRSVKPPTWFVDRIRETLAFDGLRQRTVQVEVVFLWGLFDSLEAANQRDATIDAFIDYVTDRPHGAGTNTILEPRTIEDDPNFVPDWLRPEEQHSLYATTLTLEGFAGGF